jgi:hypothetical protein
MAVGAYIHIYHVTFYVLQSGKVNISNKEERARSCWVGRTFFSLMHLSARANSASTSQNAQLLPFQDDVLGSGGHRFTKLSNDAARSWVNENGEVQ